jgi:hypothetical protein
MLGREAYPVMQNEISVGCKKKRVDEIKLKSLNLIGRFSIRTRQCTNLQGSPRVAHIGWTRAIGFTEIPP